jgi:polyisoprenyl-phosphate glycosyltransferase
VHAGLSHARGDAIVVMDSDMQDDPRAIREFVRCWRSGYDVIYAVRTQRKESAVKRALFYGFYRLLNLFSNTSLPNDAGNFGLVDRQVARYIVEMHETDRFYPGLRRWVGFRQIGVPVERGSRHDDRPRVSYLGLVRLAKTALFSFSSAPLWVFYVVSALSLCLCGSACGFTFYHKFITGRAIPGWTSIVVTASFFGAVNALGIGVLGEYVVRIYDQVRNRPKYLVARLVNFSPHDESGESCELQDDQPRQLLDEIQDLAGLVDWSSPRDATAALSDPSRSPPGW